MTLAGVSFATLSNVGGRSCSMSFLCSYPPKFLDAPADAGFWLRELFGCCFQLPNFVNKMTSAFSKVASTFGLFPCLFRYQPDVFFFGTFVLPRGSVSCAVCRLHALFRRSAVFSSFTNALIFFRPSRSRPFDVSYLAHASFLST